MKFCSFCPPLSPPETYFIAKLNVKPICLCLENFAPSKLAIPLCQSMQQLQQLHCNMQNFTIINGYQLEIVQMFICFSVLLIDLNRTSIFINNNFLFFWGEGGLKSFVRKQLFVVSIHCGNEESYFQISLLRQTFIVKESVAATFYIYISIFIMAKSVHVCN